MPFSVKLFLTVFFLTSSMSWGATPVANRADIDDLLYCLVNLDEPNSILWKTPRANGHGQTLADHLFINHNGATGHTAIRSVLQPSQQMGRIAIVQAISAIIHMVNLEIIRLANFNAIGIHKPANPNAIGIPKLTNNNAIIDTHPIVNLNTIIQTVNNDDIIRNRVNRFFSENAWVSNANGLRCFSIYLPLQRPIPSNILLEDRGTIPDRPTIQGYHDCSIIKIWLPSTRGNRTPTTVFLD